MSIKVLFFDDDVNWARTVDIFCKDSKIELCQMANIADIRLKITQDPTFNLVVIDISTPKRSILEVIRYLKLNIPSVKIILTVSDMIILNKLGLTSGALTKLGVEDVLVKPYGQAALIKSIHGIHQFESWQTLKNQDEEEDDQEEAVREQDDRFTGVKLENYISGSVNVFDLYLRTSRNNYIRIFHRGKKFNKQKLEKHQSKENIEYLYFKTADRGTYINFTNKLLEKMIDKDINVGKKAGLVKEVSEIYIDEIFTKGIDAQIVTEGEAVCRNIYNLIQEDDILFEMLESYLNLDNSFRSHLFGTMFFSSVICKNVEWASGSTVEKTCLGAMLHDIGKLKLPEIFKTLSQKVMTPSQLMQYKSHPAMGVEMLAKFPTISEPVKQIVYQHHEMADGSGFPSGLPGIRIFPLARIVSLANHFSNYIVEKNMAPKQAIHPFVMERNTLIKFDQVLIKSLIIGFIKKGKS
ncbi:MAG: hypothetical protein A2381_11730 [Bdellovibrionales bacterium RIFOXYB1_FULL_37_110]|nr:MAG: hypothetical protein A2181_05565 [Bdellovibrionales bacterium RIFOXYA1_FULL_38_20]OFZ49225.1 MAG: hypothetical protein A2417_16970 [Bdellovibrionales bacterium RIFOXYC1_FULL_37_79]OFZ58473.1 MAG: hypothetical protein A2381_11730 [Bdellovibrionales bacterium RIFOXYB1_FULL_37_110]OFZ61486.1 MAG: hypothetical protein A2577_00250 [Bdellovibrionales bacterium RIFOXYD1_FULL_36_51]